MDNQNLPDTFKLPQINTLEIKNYSLQRRIYQLEIEKIALLEELWISDVSKIVNADLHNYVINPDTGVCTIKPEIKNKLQNTGDQQEKK